MFIMLLDTWLYQIVLLIVNQDNVDLFQMDVGLIVGFVFLQNLYVKMELV